MKQKSKNGLEVRQADGKGMVSFSADEVNLIYQFGEKGKEGTLANLKEIEPRIADAVTKKLVGSTIHKLSGLSDQGCVELISTIKSSKIAERDSSIRERLAKAKEQIKRPSINGGKKREQPKKEGMEL